jgi:hypothetical protein
MKRQEPASGNVSSQRVAVAAVESYTAWEDPRP